MRRLALLAFALVVPSAFAQYAADGVRLLAQIPPNQFAGSPTAGSAIFGWTSPSGREIAIMGLNNGEAVIDITNPTQPVVLNHIPGPNSSWHENVTMHGYCYAVTDSTGAIGIRIIDLTRVDQGLAPLAGIYDGQTASKPLSNVHTIQADPDTRRVFANGSNRGFVVFDASNPTNLVELGRWTTRYVHDSLIVNHQTGPWAGKQIAYLFCGTNGLYIVDITNPAQMVTLGATELYPGGGNNTYCHSGVISPDLRYVMLNDEFDENRGLTNSATTIICDVSNLTQPTRVGQFASGVPTIDHNSVLRDGKLFLSAYKAGLRIYEASNPLAMREIGFFDTYPSSTNMSSYAGNWGVYASFPSRNVILSDMQRGFFVVDPSEAIGLGAPIVSTFLDTARGTIPRNGLREQDQVIARLNPATRTQLSFRTRHQTSRSARNSVDVSLTAKGQADYRILVKNVSTGQFESVRQFFGVADEFRTGEATGLSASRYIDSNGFVEVRISAFFTGRITPTVGVDQVKVTVNP